MLTRTITDCHLLDQLIDRGYVSVDRFDNGWKPADDRATLYEAAINSLLEQARTEGLTIYDGGFATLGEVQVVEQDADCIGLDNGCTCAACGELIADAVGYSAGSEVFCNNCTDRGEPTVPRNTLL